jgi:hypothetical protein
MKLCSSSSVNFRESFASAPRAAGGLVLNLVMGGRREGKPRASHVEMSDGSRMSPARQMLLSQSGPGTDSYTIDLHRRIEPKAPRTKSEQIVARRCGGLSPTGYEISGWKEEGCAHEAAN